MQSSWRLLGLSLLVAAGLQALVPAAPVRIDLADAPDHEGARVLVAGAVRSVHAYGPETSRFVLAADGHGLEARLDGLLPVGQGEWVEVTGGLDRSHGRLILFADSVQAGAPPAPAKPAWTQIAQDPEHWGDRWIKLHGRLIDGRLHGDGVSVHMGEGPWPDQGAVEATGVLAYEPDCLCHAFHAHAVRAWTA